MRSLLLIPLLAGLALAGCAKGDNEPGPGGVTVGEARALDEAAAMLDERRPGATVVPTPLPSLAPVPTPTVTPIVPIAADTANAPLPAPAPAESARTN
ncbi:MAG TPA: hypothetical protein VM055_05895 [Novosphingobium sp.]|nr:hypothetical protein [Novosphingobium sp.]